MGNEVYIEKNTIGRCVPIAAKLAATLLLRMAILKQKFALCMT